ncbi:chromate transporter [Paenibacillus ginsengarvi]|uniref:Chromate transporter n=1 Tax=Paenibacillus ginsengarvi TaxID=400777 RepID=A0A3B0CTI3_9BACL|nr:chromate transporter [Paenibacillus ginsengarvi]RKN86447.1 chromate transporter [Paenibacillus ginsengarvi]
MLWDMFLTFMLIGFVSVGGGYSMVPVIEREALSHGWMNAQAFSDMIAVAGASPGPIATNTAIMVGYHAGGFPGAAVSAIGMTLPSLLLVIAAGMLFAKYQHHPLVESAFYGLRPFVTALVFYAAYRLLMAGGVSLAIDWKTGCFIAIFAGALIALMRFRVHPLAVIAVSGLVGVALYA